MLHIIHIVRISSSSMSTAEFVMFYFEACLSVSLALLPVSYSLMCHLCYVVCLDLDCSHLCFLTSVHTQSCRSAQVFSLLFLSSFIYFLTKKYLVQKWTRYSCPFLLSPQKKIFLLVTLTRHPQFSLVLAWLAKIST